MLLVFGTPHPEQCGLGSYSVQAVELLYPRFSFLGHHTLNGVAWRSYSIQAVGLQCGLGELQHSGCRTAMQGSCSLLGHHTLNGAAWRSYSSGCRTAIPTLLVLGTPHPERCGLGSYSVQAVGLSYPRFSLLEHHTLNGVAWGATAFRL
jgi:hypothetical protein